MELACRDFWQIYLAEKIHQLFHTMNSSLLFIPLKDWCRFWFNQQWRFAWAFVSLIYKISVIFTGLITNLHTMWVRWACGLKSFYKIPLVTAQRRSSDTPQHWCFIYLFEAYSSANHIPMTECSLYKCINSRNLSKNLFFAHKRLNITVFTWVLERV